jgi:hypothetical protein
MGRDEEPRLHGTPKCGRRLSMKRIIVSVLAALAVAAALPLAAEARCPVGDSGITVNRADAVAKFKRLTPNHQSGRAGRGTSTMVN